MEQNNLSICGRNTIDFFIDKAEQALLLFENDNKFFETDKNKVDAIDEYKKINDCKIVEDGDLIEHVFSHRLYTRFEINNIKNFNDIEKYFNSSIHYIKSAIKKLNKKKKYIIKKEG